MTLSKEGGENFDEDSGDVKLLDEIDAIRKALYLDIKTSKNSCSSSITNFRSQSVGRPRLPDTKPNLKSSNEEKGRKEKKSLWSKTLMAFSHVRNRRFDCCFTLQVHSIEGLPPSFNDVGLCVYWKRRDRELMTYPAKVYQGTAEFEEELIYTCPVYGSRSGPHHSAKYEAKQFLLYASVYGEPELDLGKHRVDLTRLLPLTLEELEEEKSSGKWTTSYELSGRGKRARLNISFRYSVTMNSSRGHGNQQIITDTFNKRQHNRDVGKAEMKFGRSDGKSFIRRTESLPSKGSQRSVALSQYVEDMKDLLEVLPVSLQELAISMDVLSKKLDEDKLVTSVDYKPEHDTLVEHVDPIKMKLFPLCDHEKENLGHNCEEFQVSEQGVELSSLNERVKLEKDDLNDVDVISLSGPDVDRETDFLVPHEKSIKLDCNYKERIYCKDEIDVSESCFDENMSTKEMESTINCVSAEEIAALESLDEQQTCIEVNSDHVTIRGKSLSSDDDLVANEFLNMLGIEHSPFSLTCESESDSPRERLLRTFEKEALADGCSLFNSDIFGGDQAGLDSLGASYFEWDSLADNFDLASAVLAAEKEHQMETMAENSKTKAKQLENQETEALMQEWSLNETAFQNSPPSSSSGIGNPVHFHQEAPIELPALGDGLGPILQTKNGGFVRSMNPSVLNNAKSGGSLIVQVSSPVVLPAEMGSEIMEVIQRLALVGIEKLSVQASKLMPLEDITGKTMHQVAWEASSSLDGHNGDFFSHNDTVVGQKEIVGRSPILRSNKVSSSSNSFRSEIGPEYVSLEHLAPSAMDEIEALSIEGLRIQSGQSNEDAPLNISSQAIGGFSTLQGKRIDISRSLSLEGTGGLELLDVKDGNNNIDGLIGLSLTLEEWMRLDSGELDDEDCTSERTSRILAAHHANSLDSIGNGLKGEKKRGEGSSRKAGLLGSNFTVAISVQLRDPWRNYEPVGTPMLALIQVERVFVPPNQGVESVCSYIKVVNIREEDVKSESSVGNNEPTKEPNEEETSEEKAIPHFRITQVHIAGIETKPSKKLWGSSHQQKSASRWFIANGMAKNDKHPFMKSKAAAKATSSENVKAQPGDKLWSISSRVHRNGAELKESAALNPHIRNPNVIFPNKSIRLQ